MKYKNFHLNKYRTLTPGVVTNVTSDYYGKSGTWTYYTEYKYYVNNTLKKGLITSSYKKYNEGDSVKIVYSYKDPGFNEIDEKEN